MNGPAAVSAYDGRAAQAGHWGDPRRQRSSVGETPARRESEDLLQADGSIGWTTDGLRYGNNGCSDVLFACRCSLFCLIGKTERFPGRRVLSEHADNH